MSVQNYNDLYSQYLTFWSFEEFAEQWLKREFPLHIEKNKIYKAALGWDWIKENTTQKELLSYKELYDDIVEFCNKETIYEMFKYNEKVYIGVTHITSFERQSFEEKTYDSEDEYEQGDENNFLLLASTNYDCNVCLREPYPNQLYMFSDNIVGICKQCWRQGYRFNHDGTKIFTPEGNDYPHTNVNYYPEDSEEEKEEEEEEEEYDSDASTVIAGDNNT